MQTETSDRLFSFSRFVDEPLRGILGPVEPAIEKLFWVDRLRQTVDEARADGGPGMAARLLRLLGVAYDLHPGELERIPASGPVLVVANHPFGLLEGAILQDALARVRPDVRILANSMLSSIAEVRDNCIFVDPFGRRNSTNGNASGLKECASWLRQGGLLAAFPAGEVAHLSWNDRAVVDPPWNPAVARIAKLTGAATVPVLFEGANSLGFQLAGVVHSGLRTLSLPRELLNKRGRRIQVRIGRPIPHSTLLEFSDRREAVEYLRCRTYMLQTVREESSGPVRSFPAILLQRKAAPVAPPMPRRELISDISRLPASRRLCETNNLAVYLGSASEVPSLVREIGRLREIAFRGVGEGAGRSLDLDRFDRHYLHLILWNQNTDEVVGAYRLGPTPDILPRQGPAGLYTSTLFRYRKDLFERLGPAVELGRSFVRPEYQKQYAPLLMLWKGIGCYVASRPECPTLFGGVSISNDYHPVSRHLIVKFLEAHRAERLAGLVSPRTPYRPANRILHGTGLVSRIPTGVDELSEMISDLESDGKGVPILIKQYLKTGGRLLAFNVDRRFSNALDALIMVDMRNAPPALLDRYMGKSGAAKFKAWHAGIT